jgi:hypothetical protein
MAQRNQKDWRELCTAVANETDSNKLGSLVQELIKALDERDQNGVLQSTRFVIVGQSHKRSERLPATPTCGRATQRIAKIAA